MNRESRRRIREALAPMAYLTGVALPCCLTTAYLFRDRPALAVALVLTGFAPVATAGGLFLYFRRADH